MLRSRLWIAVIVLQALLLSGCWDRIEINDVALMTGVAIDKDEEDKYVITAEVYIPRMIGSGGSSGGGGGSQGAQTFIRSGKGDTLAGAVSNLQLKLPRQVFWGQTKVIIFGEKIAKSGIRTAVDFISRHPQPRLRAYLFVAKGKGGDVLALQPPLESSSSEVLRELAKSEVMLQVNLKELLQMTRSDAETAALPMVRVLPAEKGMDSKQTIEYIYQTALFQQDRMVGQVGAAASRGMLWFRDEVRSANITIRHKGGGDVSMALIHVHSKLIPKIQAGKWRMTLQADADADVIVNGSRLDLSHPAFVAMLQRELNEELGRRLRETLDKVQKELKLDVFGFAEHFHRRYPDEWRKAKKEWDEIFPRVAVDLDLKLKIRSPGMATAPQGLPEDEVRES